MFSSYFLTFSFGKKTILSIRKIVKTLFLVITFLFFFENSDFRAFFKNALFSFFKNSHRPLVISDYDGVCILSSTWINEIKVHSVWKMHTWGGIKTRELRAIGSDAIHSATAVGSVFLLLVLTKVDTPLNFFFSMYNVIYLINHCGEFSKNNMR